MALRKIVRIDEKLCTGCGACVAPCAEGAIQIIDGKARVVSETLCDGAGFCIGTCPEGALTIEEREAPDFSEEAVEEHLKRKPRTYIPQSCFRCGADEDAVPLLPVRHQGNSLWACARCLPALIHGSEQPAPRHPDQTAPDKETKETIEDYLDRPIQEILEEFPPITDILEGFDIGCVPCSAGSCLLRDIVEIHNLSAEDERELMTRIARVIFPHRDVEVPPLRGTPRTPPAEITYSPPMKKLVDEHVVIKRLVALIPRIAATLDLETEEGRSVIRDSVDFIRSYADKYHHAKEEEILFKLFRPDLDILQVMHQDHENARAHVQAILEALDGSDGRAVAEHLTAYHDLLTEHIKREDEILYPWMDRHLSMTQIGELFAAFQQVDEDFGDAPRKYQAFVRGLEETVTRRQDHAST